MKYWKKSNLRRSVKSSGFSMVEILVAIVVVSVGLLGYAGLLARSAKLNYESLLRTQATMLSYDILERLRGNRVLALMGKCDVAKEGKLEGAGMCSTEVTNWKTNLSRYLPAGDGPIAVTANSATITIYWTIGDKAYSFITQSKL